MIAIPIVVILLTGLFFSAFFSGAETGLYCINRLRIALGERQRDARDLRLARLLKDEQGTLAVTLAGTNVMNYITTTTAAYALANLLHYSDADTEILTVVILTPIVFVFGEVVPKNLFERHADSLMRRGSGLLTLADRAFRLVGIVAGLKAAARAGNRLLRFENSAIASIEPKRRVAAMLHDALVEREHGLERSDLIDRVVSLADTPLHPVMVPRNRVVTIAAGANRAEFLRVARRTLHNRLPVHDDGPRSVVGVVNVDELLADDAWETVSQRMNAPVRVGPHVSVAGAITQLQAVRREMAIVTDRGGRMLGIVTLSDLLREIVGDLGVGD